MNNHYTQFITAHESSHIDDFGKFYNLVIAVGGDGTFLAAARGITPFDISLIGVNHGRLGFLVVISSE